MQPVVSQKSLSLLSFKLLTQLEKIKCKRFEWIKDAREGILKSWGESRVEYRDWLQQVTHEIQQLNDMGDGASAEWLAHTLLREPSILESPHLELTIPTGQGMEVIIFKGFAEGAYTVTPAGHHPSQVEAAPSRATEDPIVPEPPRTPAVTMRSEPVAPDTSAAELTEGPTIAARNQVPRARETVSHPQRPTGETSGENNSSIGDAAPVKGKTAPATAKFRHLAAKPPAVERTEAPKTTADGHLTGVHEIVARLDEVGEGSGEHNSSTGDGAVVEEDAYANDITFIKECPDKRRPASKKKRKRRAASAPANNEDNETIGRKSMYHPVPMGSPTNGITRNTPAVGGAPA